MYVCIYLFRLFIYLVTRRRLSTYTVVVIAIDRCAAVLDPLSQRTTARRRTRILVGVTWLLSAVFSLPQVTGDHRTVR